MDKLYVSKERLEELKQELQELKTTKRFEIAELLKRAKEYGDLSENAEYSQAREEQNRVEQRIFELDEMLKNVEVITKPASGNVVGVGSKVTLKKNGQTFSYTIVGSNEAKPEEGMISNESPIGKSVLGKKAGESATVHTPAGDVAYQIVKIG